MQNSGNRKFSKRHQLLRAAMEEFADNYYDGTSLNRILENSEVGKGTFYYHFENKKTLYSAVIDELIRRKLEFFRARTPKESAGDDIFSTLRQQGTLSAEFVISDPVLEKLSIRISHEPNPEIRGLVKRKTGSGAAEYMRKMVSEAVEAGALRRDLPEDFILRLLTFLFNNFASVFTSETASESEGHNEILLQWDYFMDFIKAGLAGRDADS